MDNHIPDFNTVDIDELVKDHKLFNDFVYTPADKAIEELSKRRNNRECANSVKSKLSSVPKPLEEGPRAVLFRHVATPNHEVIRFLTIAELMGLQPLFLEYLDDKFVPKNELKYYLGRMAFYQGIGKKGGVKFEYEKIIDFLASDGKKISTLKTLWGQDFVSFHHSLFQNRGVDKETFFDVSSWLHTNGNSASHYYKNFLTLLICNGILFENLLLDKQEVEFTRTVFLPAFIEVYKEFGIKPLIVALEPTEIETDIFWMSHPYQHKNFMEQSKINHKRLTPWGKLIYNINYAFRHLF